jgi:hypothetical protein
MNITNKQLGILVDEIYKNTFQDLVKKESEELANERAAVKLTKQEEKFIADYVELHQKYLELVENTYNYSRKSVINVREEILVVRRNKIQKAFKSTFPTKAEIESALVLATVDAKDLNDLMNAVKAKFKIK